jgi:hypothetical protein
VTEDPPATIPPDTPPPEPTLPLCPDCGQRHWYIDAEDE